MTDQFTLDRANALEFIRSDKADIPDDWDPRAGDGHDVAGFVYDARDAGVISMPPGTDLDFEDASDSDGPRYMWFIRVGNLFLSSGGSDLDRIGERDARGARAALAILDEGAAVGNRLLDDLAEHVRKENARA